MKKIEGSGKSHAHKIQQQRSGTTCEGMGKTQGAVIAYIEKMKKIASNVMKESVHKFKMSTRHKYDKKLRSCVPKSGFVHAYPFFGRSKDTSNQSGQNAQGSNGQSGNGQTGNGNGGGTVRKWWWWWW